MLSTLLTPSTAFPRRALAALVSVVVLFFTYDAARQSNDALCAWDRQLYRYEHSSTDFHPSGVTGYNHVLFRRTAVFFAT